MRFLVSLVALAALTYAAPAATQGRGRPQRDQDAAFHAMQQGDILPLNVILSRVRVNNARYIGADLDPSGTIYRLTFMGPDGTVVRLHVNARTGRPLGFTR